MIGSFANVLKMRAMQALVAAAIGTIASVAACSPKAADGTDSAAAGGAAPADSMSIVKERLEDLTGDGVPEKLTVTARGPKIDSLRVHLEIRGAGDSVLYASSWDSHFYFQYLDRPAMSDAAADSTVRRRLDAVLADTAFRVGVRGAPGDTINASMMRDAIRYDIATHRLRTARGLGPGAELPRAAHDSVNVLAGTVPRAEIEALFNELKTKKSFTYFAGGEVTYSIAWSDRERRFVTIFSCC